MQMQAAGLAICAAMAAAGCQRAMDSPAAPTAVRESPSFLNADGSTQRTSCAGQYLFIEPLSIEFQKNTIAGKAFCFLVHG